jgi:hypothetical protein
MGQVFVHNFGHLRHSSQSSKPLHCSMKNILLFPYSILTISSIYHEIKPQYIVYVKEKLRLF